MKLAKPLMIILMGIILTTGGNLAAQEDIQSDEIKEIKAHPLNGEIRVDGILDEPDWRDAASATGFRQNPPNEGEPATENTIVKVLYGTDAIYVGFWCNDSEPDKIIRQLTRRDRYSESDCVTFRIDSYHDHQTAHYFNINASGVKRDILFFDNQNMDVSWDAVWDAQSRITSRGWTAEFRIPYSALRFSDSKSHEWGIDFTRYIPRKNEFSRWQFVSSSENGGVARYGHLVGLENIQTPGRLETLPYFVSHGTREPQSQGNPDGLTSVANFGGNIKYSLSSNFLLDATVNPDFSEVEFDNAVTNLGNYETHYSEHRPFFMEGTDIFHMPYFNQFYSRRIGRAPSGWADSVDYVTEYPDNTTILGAMKLTGRTKSGTSIGVLNATTQEESMDFMTKVDSLGNQSEHSAVVEPMANYSVMRVKQDIGNSSYIGGMITGLTQKGFERAITASADWSIYSSERNYRFSGSVVGSHNGPGTAGAAYFAQYVKVSGKFHRGNIATDYYDRKINLNRMGYLYPIGYWGISSWQQFYTNSGFGPVQFANINFNYYYNRLASKHRYWNGGNVNGFMRFDNQWTFNWGIGGRGTEYDIDETGGLGLWKKPGRFNSWASVGTNPAKPLQIELNANFDEDRDGPMRRYSLWFNLRPMTNLELSLGSSYYTRRNAIYAVGQTVFEDQENYPVFGRLDLNDINFNTRGTYTFTRDLTVQWTAQMYLSARNYSDAVTKLTAPDKMEAIETTDPVMLWRNDENRKSFRLSMVMRWEFRPGSSLMLVWNHNRGENSQGYGDSNFSRDIGDLFATPQTNTISIKANYWWNI